MMLIKNHGKEIWLESTGTFAAQLQISYNYWEYVWSLLYPNLYCYD